MSYMKTSFMAKLSVVFNILGKSLRGPNCWTETQDLLRVVSLHKGRLVVWCLVIVGSWRQRHHASQIVDNITSFHTESTSHLEVNIQDKINKPLAYVTHCAKVTSYETALWTNLWWKLFLLTVLNGIAEHLQLIRFYRLSSWEQTFIRCRHNVNFVAINQQSCLKLFFASSHNNRSDDINSVEPAL